MGVLEGNEGCFGRLCRISDKADHFVLEGAIANWSLLGAAMLFCQVKGGIGTFAEINGYFRMGACVGLCQALDYFAGFFERGKWTIGTF